MSQMDDFDELVNGDKVTVVVGNSSKTFLVPKMLLCKVDWFKRALEDYKFKEGAEGKITLPEDSPSAFAALQYYLYRSHLLFPPCNEIAKEDWRAHLEYCVNIWVFGDRYGIAELQNCIIFRICDALRWIAAQEELAGELSYDTLATCFHRTCAGSALRKIAADYVVWRVQNDQVPASDFAGLAASDGFMEELFKSQSVFHYTADSDFPRYLKPVRNRAIFQVGSETEYVDAKYMPDFDAMEVDCEQCGLARVESWCPECRTTDKCDCERQGGNPRVDACDVCFNGV